ncbi:MAG TPA: GTPase [Hyphomicrobiaceae bacterium]|nr:GTPase [Hyphomicrobiaceae bacterium]
MSKPRERMSFPRIALLAVALLLPTISLVPLGTLWLWEHGAVLYWALAMCVVVAGAYILQRRLIVPLPAKDLAATDSLAELGDPAWTPRQEEAWSDVLTLAGSVEANRITSRDALVSLGMETIEVVARRLHPERREPLLQFTVPEALAVIERASGGLHEFITRTFPLGDRITVAQVMWLYRWRGAVGLIEKGYDLWRIVRLLNPVSAATQELRERFTRQIYELGREHVGRRLAHAFVKEVGRAAIDLYGGNLRAGEIATERVSSASRSDLQAIAARKAEPIRILVAGQTGAGKSSLVNALANAIEAAVDVLPATRSFTPHTLTHEGLPAALIIDSPGLAEIGTSDDLVAAADDCDMLLWVCAATRPARDLDRQALGAIRAHAAAQPNRRRPPMLLVLTHIDTLRPFNEWEPPYDLTSTARAKAVAIRGAMEAAGADLGFAAGEIVPVRTDIAVAPYNIEALWAKIIELVPEAQRALLLRTLRDVKSEPAWRAVLAQAASTGRIVRDALLSRSEAP